MNDDEQTEVIRSDFANHVDWLVPQRRAEFDAWLKRVKADVWDEAARKANDFILLDDGIDVTEMVLANPYVPRQS